ncbi:hypothetical protein [Alkalicoccus saliphilus]|uniref:Uncharacterized protein n=1 Tax=Alkalicoccus saliphilus TaxID=200989 RepID=A0A2T4U3Z0_9BACI|nr:hypothetical protein [Alkalicoccus saliphilus]PTL38114.1 hypothetical protein C6Y45_13040 [Alkalicoccus saliphilus]
MTNQKKIDLDAIDSAETELDTNESDEQENLSPARRSVYEKFTKKKPGPKKKLKNAEARTFFFESQDLEMLVIESEKQNISQSEYMRRALKSKIDADRNL